MKTFTDRQGRSLTIEVNYTSLRRVKAAPGVDLTRLVDPQADIVGQLTSDPFILFDCLVAILAAGVALVGLGGTIQLVAFGFGGLATAIRAVASLLGALLSPIGLVLAGIGALAAYLINTSDLGGQALDWLGQQFEALKSTAMRAFGGIGDALAAGDLGLAARILWLTLKMEWQRGINALNQLWIEVKRFFVAVWTEAVYGAAEVAANAWAGLQTGWTETVDFLADAWTLFTTGLTKTWNTGGGTQHITQSLGTVGAWAAPGLVPPNFRGGIGVTKDGIEGVDITGMASRGRTSPVSCDCGCATPTPRTRRH
jgi:hypothetical protein